MIRTLKSHAYIYISVQGKCVACIYLYLCSVKICRMQGGKLLSRLSLAGVPCYTCCRICLPGRLFACMLALTAGIIFGMISEQLCLCTDRHPSVGRVHAAWPAALVTPCQVICICVLHVCVLHVCLQAHGVFDMKEPYYRQLNTWAAAPQVQALPQAQTLLPQQPLNSISVPSPAAAVEGGDAATASDAGIAAM